MTCNVMFNSLIHAASRDNSSPGWFSFPPGKATTRWEQECGKKYRFSSTREKISKGTPSTLQQQPRGTISMFYQPITTQDYSHLLNDGCSQLISDRPVCAVSVWTVSSSLLWGVTLFVCPFRSGVACNDKPALLKCSGI